MPTTDTPQTIQDVIGDYTPLSNNVVKILKLVKGAIACKIFYTSNLRDRVCRMGLTRIADDLGIDRSVASRNIKKLVEEGYIDKVREATHTEPAHYRMTQKFYNLASEQLPEVQTEKPAAPVDNSNRGVAESNRGVAESNQEEETEEDLTTITTNVVISASPLAPSTPDELLLFKLINQERHARGYGDAKKFPTVACKNKFDKAAERLNGSTETAIKDCFTNLGVIAIPKVVAYVAQWQKDKPKGYQNNGQTRRTYATDKTPEAALGLGEWLPGELD